MSRRTAILARVLAVVIVGVLLWWFLHRMDWHALGNALRRATLWPLVPAALLYFMCLFGKALSWRIMLEPRNVVGVGHLFRYTIAAFAASSLTPARAGELLRVWALKRRDGVPVITSTAVALAEKLLDAITLLLFCAPIPLLLPELPSWVANTILLATGIALGLFIAIFVAVGRMRAREARSWFGRLIVGMHVVRSPARLLLVIATKLLAWAADLVMVMFVLDAVGLHLSIVAGMFILFTFNLAIAIPATPGAVGALQVGVLVATDLLGIPREPALAFALLYQVAQIVPVLVTGLVLELDLVLGRVPEVSLTR